jgi:hypothetical protein
MTKTATGEPVFGAVSTAAMAFCTTAFFFVLHAAARQGFQIESSQYASGLALASVLNFGPIVLARGGQDEPGRTSLGSLLLIVATVLAGWLLMEVPGKVEVGLWVAGAVTGGVVFWRRRGMPYLGMGWMAPLMGLLFAGWMAICFWSAERSGYASPLFLENLAKGTCHVDTLFHSALAGMMQTYHVAATGLDGVVFMPYHWGSHVAVAGWSRLSGVLPLEFYTTVFQPVFLPWFLAALMQAAAVLVGRMGVNVRTMAGGRGWLLGALGLWLTQQHVTLPFFDSVNHCKASQSFVLSMIWYVHLAILGEGFLGEWAAASGGDRGFLLRRGLGLLGLFALGVFFKISTAVMFGAVFAVAGWVWLGWRCSRYWLIGGSLGLVLLGVARFVVNLKRDPGAAGWAGGLHHNLAQSGLSYAGYYAAQFWPWLLAVGIVLLVVRRGAIELGEGRRQWGWLGLAGAMALFGELPNWLMSSSGSAYFSKVVVTVMPVFFIAMLVGHGDVLRLKLREMWNPRELVLPQRLLILVVAVVTLQAVLSVLSNSCKDAGRQLLAGRRPYVADEAVKRDVAAALKAPHQWHAALLLKTSGRGRLKSAGSLIMLKALKRKGEESPALCREEALFVPRSNEAYWGLLYGNTVPYVLPALTRRCQLFGLPDPELKGMFYGLVHYPRRFEPVKWVPTVVELDGARVERCPATVQRVLEVDEKGVFHLTQ